MVESYEQPDGSPALIYEAPGHERSRADSAEEALLQSLQEGEQTYLFAECLRRLKMHIFERAVVAVTDRRLIVIGPAFPWGHTVKEVHPLLDCTVVNGKERVDGSRLMVLRHERGTLCLYFARSHRDEADAVLNAVGFQPPGAEVVLELPVEPESPARAMDPVIGVQQFSELVRSLQPDDEEDLY